MVNLVLTNAQRSNSEKQNQNEYIAKIDHVKNAYRDDVYQQHGNFKALGHQPWCDEKIVALHRSGDQANCGKHLCNAKGQIKGEVHLDVAFDGGRIEVNVIGDVGQNRVDVAEHGRVTNGGYDGRQEANEANRYAGGAEAETAETVE
jgi:hypothetical protein